jgi:uncharacterized delta-60 repeat protein
LTRPPTGERLVVLRRKLLSRLASSRAVVVALIVCLVFTAVAIAAAGDLDPTFSGDGKQTTDFGFGESDAANAVALQGDGKIVTVGRAGGDDGRDAFGLARYNPSGALDASFAGDGRQTTAFGSFAQASDVAIQANGKIVAVGRGRTSDFAVARYNLNGTLDTSFSGDGKQTTDFAGTDDADGVALQGDGKIVVAGADGGSSFALARYNANGTLDASFSGDGKLTTDFGSSAANGVVVQANGKIVAVGFMATASGGNFALVRYNPNGALDPSFSGDGKQTTDFGSNDLASGVALQGDGKIVAVGSTDEGSSPTGQFALARYNANGSLDTTFSGDGKKTTDFFPGASDRADDVAIQANGRIVAVGFARGGATGDDFALARYNPNGSLDTSFSGDGMRRTNFEQRDGANGVAIQANGRIVAVGEGGAGSSSNQTPDFALARYLGD